MKQINPFKHFKFKQIGSQIQFSDYLLPSTSYCLERRNQTIWLTAEVINRSIIIRCRPSLTQSAFRGRRDWGERTEPMRTDCSSACWVYLRVSIKSDQLLLWVQQFTGIGNVDGSLLFISSQHPDLETCFPQRCDGLGNPILKSVLNTCCSYLKRQTERFNAHTYLCLVLTTCGLNPEILKGIVHTIFFIIFADENEIYFLLLNIKEDILKNADNQTLAGHHWLLRKKYYESQWGLVTVCYLHSSKYLLLCSADEINSYRFGMTWGWVNNDNFLFVGELSL